MTGESQKMPADSARMGAPEVVGADMPRRSARTAAARLDLGRCCAGSSTSVMPG